MTIQNREGGGMRPCMRCGAPARKKYCPVCSREAHREQSRARYTPVVTRKAYSPRDRQRGPSLDYGEIDHPLDRLLIAMLYNAVLDGDGDWLQTTGREIVLTIAPGIDMNRVMGASYGD